MTPDTFTHHVVNVSSGLGSAFAWKLCLDRFGRDNVTGVFADVNGEHPDNYRFLAETTYALDGRLVKLHNDGKNIWDVFIQHRFLGNSRVDLCSRILKREAIYTWLSDRYDPADTLVHLGFDFTEEHRFTRAEPYWKKNGWTIAAPLCDPPRLKTDAQVWLDAENIKRPLLYDLGFSHANCGGGCIKAGIGQFKQLLAADRHWYINWWERGEERVRAHLGKDVAILRKRTTIGHKQSPVTDIHGEDVPGEFVTVPVVKTDPLTLRRLRHMVENDPQLQLDGDDEFGACDCFTPPDDEETPVTIGAVA